METNKIKQVLEEVGQLTNKSQDWSSYNKAKTKEKLMAQDLLLELLDYIQYREEQISKRSVKKAGRHGFALRDQLFGMYLYVYSQFSSRRAVSEIESARRRGIIPETAHFNTVLSWFRKPHISHTLLELVELTSMPLRMFEDHLSIDSSGLSTSIFNRWYDIRTKKDRKLREWKKVHLICGARTNVIASLLVTDGRVADSPQLIPLVKRASRYFEAKEVSADKAYISIANLSTISELGMIPYIPFKSVNVRRVKGHGRCKIWTAMFDYFHKNQEEFMRHYHKRSNVESTFAMLKRNFGHRLRTKGYTSQVNEILMKCICHNLSVLVQEVFELGIEIDFKKCAEVYYVNK